MELTQATEESTYQQYLEIKEQIDQLNEKLETLKPEVISLLSVHGKYSINDRSIILGERKSWEYSKTVKESEEMVKKLKKIEEIDGTAMIKAVTKFIIVR